MNRRGFLSAAALPLMLGADWPRFRGPNGFGAVELPGWPLTVPLTKNVLWQTAIPGSGHGSPIAIGGKIFLQASGANGAERRLLRIEASSGRIEWSVSRPGKSAHAHKKNSLASSTPTADAERVYVIVWDGAAVWVVGYDHFGKMLWEHKLGGYESQHGVGMSPVVHDGSVFVNYDQDGAAELVALDAKSGKQVWSKKHKAFRACYSSPLIRTTKTAVEVVNASTAGVTAYDAKTGEVLRDWVWKFDGMALRTVGSPMLTDKYLIAISGDGGGSRSMVVLTHDAAPEIVWEKKRDVPYVPGPVLHGEHLYWVTDNGIATCAELATGRIVWSERAFNKAVSASPILLGDQVLAVAEDGKAIVFAASKTGYSVTSETVFADAVFATPAAADGRIYLRTTTTLYGLGR